VKEEQVQSGILDRRGDIIVPALIALATFIVFSGALRNGFLNWDDEVSILTNPHCRGLGWANLRWMFTTLMGGHYQPLVWLTFAADYLVWGMDPFGYHLTNVLLHAANAVFFYYVASLFLSGPANPRGLGGLVLRRPSPEG